MNDTIQASALKLLLAAPESLREPQRCLRFVRTVVEDALRLPDREFYRWVTQRVPDRPADADPCARDAEKSLRALGWSVPAEQARGGDLVCSYKVSKPDGHIGVLVEVGGRLWVAENTTAERGLRAGGALALTPLHLWDPVTGVFRVRR